MNWCVKGVQAVKPTAKLKRHNSRGTTRRRPARPFSSETLEPRMLLAGDLVGHWRAESLNATNDDGQTLTSWADAVGQVSAAATGTPILVKGAMSGRSVVRFDATDGDDAFRVSGLTSPLSGAGDFSVSVAFATSSQTLQGGATTWFQNTGLVDGNTLGFGKDWGVTINQTGQIGAGMGAGLFQPHRSVYSQETGLNDGQLHVATLTRSGGTLSIYIDGGVATTITNADPNPRDSLDFEFGRLQTKQNGFTGDIAEIQLHNGTLTAAEVSALHSTLHTYYNNVAPTAIDDAYTFDEDPPFGFHNVAAANGVLPNDTDPEGDSLTAHLVEGPANGSVAMRDDGSFVYTPNRDFYGVDSFTYFAKDGQASNIATVSLTVNNVYDPAVGHPDSYKLQPTETLIVDANSGVLANDLNPDLVALTATLSTDVSNGKLTLQPDGSFTYEPQGFAGTAQFGYRINDGTTLQPETLVTLIVNTPPVGNDDSFQVDEDGTLVRDAATGVTANDVDAEGNALSVTLVDDVSHGQLDLQPDGSFTYTPLNDYSGDDTFSYTLSDGEDASGMVTVHLTVNSINDVPVGEPDSFFGPQDAVLSINAGSGVLLNDTDVETTSLTAVLATGPTHGTLQLGADGSLSYAPNVGFSGTDTFTYQASDGTALSDPITVTLYIGTPPALITEVLSANVNSLKTRVKATASDRFTGEQLTPDWIEIQNQTNAPLDISGFHLTDSRSDLTRWAFPAGTVIPAAGFLTVYASHRDITDPALDETGRLHTNFKLDIRGEFVALTSKTGQVISQFDNVPQQYPDISYGRLADGTWGHLLQLTPDSSNSNAYPGVVDDTSFSVDRGFFTEAFQVEISVPTEGATIRYTTDGSPPSATTGSVYTGPITIDKTTVLKAAAFKDGFIPSNVDAQTYLYADQVLLQDGAGLGGVRWGHRGPDWAMDPLIVNHEDPEIRPVAEDLKRIPTLSLSMDFDAMFGAGGIYIAGEDVEIPTSIEFFDPNKSDNGAQSMGTVQIVGGSSPDRWKVDKLSMRVKFTETVGASELEYPIFGADAATRFSTLTVDARLNNVWHYGGGSEPDGQRGRAQYLRDEWAADAQNAMGSTATHGQHVWVYINGIFWGIHTLHERPDEDFASTYLGGDPEDWDIIKHDSNTVLNGSNESYRELIQILSGREPLTDEQYQAASELLDIDDFLQYLQMNFYGGNEDWDHHNWYASRSPLDGKWRYHSWDAEKVLQNLRADQTGDNNSGAPTGFHRRLITHPEYALKFQDAIQRNFFHDGLLTPENAAKLYRQRADQIDLAMRAESARWGDNQIDQGRRVRYTRLDWVKNRDYQFETYFPQRTQIALNQFRARGWYEEGIATNYEINGQPQHGGFVNPGSMLAIKSSDGTIYYTTDGQDPRLEGGAIGASAQVYQGEFPLQQATVVKSRLLRADGNWGPISEARFTTSVPADVSSLRISELHYHPTNATAEEIAAGHTNADDFEFIELVNISDRTIDLSAVRLQQVVVGNDIEGVDFDFAAGSVRELAPGTRVLVVEDLDAFKMRYGSSMPIAGQWSGQLSNGGERLQLVAGEQIIHDFIYDDAWHPSTDGDGPSLEAVDPSSGNLDAWGTAAGWRPSSTVGGTPGDEEQGVVPGDSNHDGVFDSSDFVAVFLAGEYADGIPSNSSFEEGDWNGDMDFDELDLVYVFAFGHYETGLPPAPPAANAAQAAVAASLLAEDLATPHRDAADRLVNASHLCGDHERSKPRDLLRQDLVFDRSGKTADDCRGPLESTDTDLSDDLATDLAINLLSTAKEWNRNDENRRSTV